MSKRFTWLMGLGVLVSIALLVACSGNYLAYNDGVLVVPSLGSSVVESFTFDLATGASQMLGTNPVIPGPPDQGAMTSVLLSPSGNYAFMTTTHVLNSGADPCTRSSAIATFALKYDGTMTTIGQQHLNNFQGASVIPVALAINGTGNLLFVADAATCIYNPSTKATTVVPGSISVLSVGSGASLTEVSGSPFPVPANNMSGNITANPLSLALSHIGYPTAPAECWQNTPPKAQYLYVADEEGNDVVPFTVSSSGALTPIALPANQIGYPTGANPYGIKVDPCNRFVFVGNFGSNNVSAFQICNRIGFGNCEVNDWTLLPVTGSPFIAGTQPGPLVVDPFGFYLYQLDMGSNQISAFKIGQTTGSLSPLSPATYAAGQGSVSIAIRGDSSWLFVTNYTAATVSQYGVNPQTGNLLPATPIQTDAYPYGVAVR